MTLDSKITLAGALVTVLSAIFTLVQARKAKDYSEQIRKDVERIALNQVSESLHRCQNAVRLLPRKNEKKRGFDLQKQILPVWAHFDTALSSHALTSENTDIRSVVIEAQDILRSYQTSNADGTIDPAAASLRLQDALSTISSRIYKIEGKK